MSIFNLVEVAVYNLKKKLWTQTPEKCTYKHM